MIQFPNYSEFTGQLEIFDSKSQHMRVFWHGVLSVIEVAVGGVRYECAA